MVIIYTKGTETWSGLLDFYVECILCTEDFFSVISVNNKSKFSVLINRPILQCFSIVRKCYVFFFLHTSHKSLSEWTDAPHDPISVTCGLDVVWRAVSLALRASNSPALWKPSISRSCIFVRAKAPLRHYARPIWSVFTHTHKKQSLSSKMKQWKLHDKYDQEERKQNISCI